MVRLRGDILLALMSLVVAAGTNIASAPHDVLQNYIWRPHGNFPLLRKAFVWQGVAGNNETRSLSRVRREGNDDVQKRVEAKYARKNAICKNLSLFKATSQLTAETLDTAASVAEAVPILGPTCAAPFSVSAGVAKVAAAETDLMYIQADCDSVPFDEIKDIMKERFDSVDKGLDRNFAAIQDLTLQVREGFASVDRDLNRNYEAIILVQNKVEDLSLEMLQSKINWLTSRLITTVKEFKYLKSEIREGNRNLDTARVASKLYHFFNPDHDPMRELQRVLDEMVAHRYSKPDSARDSFSFSVLEHIFWGVQNYFSMISFMVDKYSYICEQELQNEQIDEFNTCVDNTYHHFGRHKSYLIPQQEFVSGSLVQRVTEVFRNAEKLELLEETDLELYQSLALKIQRLKDIGKETESLELPRMKTASVGGLRVEYRSGGALRKQTVQYAVQYREEGRYFKVSDWSRPFHAKVTSPTVILPSEREQGLTRIVYRKFEGQTAELVAIIEDSGTNEFQDSSRELFNSALSPELNSGVRVDRSAVNLMFAKGWTVLHAAASQNNWDFVKKALEQGADVNAQDRNGDTPIHLAARFDFHQTVELLVGRSEAKTDLRNNLGLTPLHIAANKGFVKTLQVLTRKADVNAKDKGGFTPLFSTLTKPEAMQTLLNSRRIDVNAKNDQGLTALHAAVLVNGTEAVTKLLQISGIDVNPMDKTSSTPLYYAVINDRLDIFKSLVNHPNIAINKGRIPPLHMAVSLGRTNIVDYLIIGADIRADIINERAAIINERAEGLLTPLHMAVLHGQTEMVVKLLDANAVTRLMSENGLTALHFAIIYKHVELAKEIIKRSNQFRLGERANSGKTSFMIACEKGLIEIMADIYSVIKSLGEEMDDDSNTELHWAARKGRSEAVQLILQTMLDSEGRTNELKLPSLNKWEGMDKYKRRVSSVLEDAAKLKGTTLSRKLDEFINKKNSEGKTALHLASGVDSETVQFLVYYGAKVNTEDNDKSSPLHEACSTGDLSTVKFLMENGAKVEARDKAGRTPLHVASSGGFADIVSHLITKRHNVNLQDNERKTPLYYAKTLQVVKLLEQNKADVSKGPSPVSNCKSLDVLLHFESKTETIYNLRETDDKGRSMLYSCRSARAVEYLIGKKRFAHFDDLTVEASCHSLEILKYYVEVEKGRVNIGQGVQPILKAVECNRIDIVKYLVSKGADYKVEGDGSPFCKAIERKLTGIVEYFHSIWDKERWIRGIACPGSLDQLQYAIRLSNLETIEYLARTGLDVNPKSGTPLFLAINNDRYDIVRLLTNLGARIPRNHPHIDILLQKIQTNFKGYDILEP